jgi:hypothetical protein
MVTFAPNASKKLINMRILSVITLFLVLLSQTESKAQKRYSRNTNKNVFEIYAGVGITNFLGDLGGANQIGTNFAKDLDIEATRPVLTIGGKYFYHPRIAQRLSLSYGWLRGDDKWTKEVARESRNLNFRSPIFEINTGFEIYLLTESSPKNRYALSRARTKGQNPVGIYLFGGVGGFYFNPKGQNLNTGEWEALQPLRTEGQGWVNTRSPYRRFQLCVPMGLGFTFRLAPEWRLGLDLGLRKTFTDYVDDVSTQYVDPAVFLLNGSSDPASSEYFGSGKYIGQTSGPGAGNVAGQQRGDPKDRDAYMFLTINVQYRFGRNAGSMPKFF